MARRLRWLAGGAFALAIATLGAAGVIAHHRATRQASALTLVPSTSDSAERPGAGPVDDVRSHAFRIPSGLAPSLTCEAARAIVAQAREQLGYRPEPVDARSLAEAAADWLDPYGLWSVAPDAPVGAAFNRRAGALLAEIEGRVPGGCAAARLLGASLASWVTDLRQAFDQAAAEGAVDEDLSGTVSASAFEGATVTRPARALAAMLGRRLGSIRRQMGAPMEPYLEAARARYFPPLDADAWADMVLAAAVRAYVPSIDPHGAWAPLDEESSVYEVDLEARPPTRLWDKAERTAIGIKIESGAAPPLADGDVLLSLGGLATAGLSYEQVEQLGYAASDLRPPAQAVLLHPGDKKPVTTWLDDGSIQSRAASGSPDDSQDLPVERVAYGDGDVITVAIHDVRDDLGDELTRSILHEREREGRALIGVVLDLRGNGGGSTDGAIDALGLFLPGASLFPMKRRDGSLETDRAPEPPNVDRWRGPVATLVDGDTASAAEMVAGALASYRRGPVLGSTTFGKGCAQEYIDDDEHAGVLRLTTLLYALPDGTPVQRVGLTPTLRLPFGPSDTTDRESALLHAPPLWRGPDVRDRASLAHGEDGTWTIAWPSNAGNVGPCKDADVCRALRLLGSAPPTARRTAQGKGR
ncbi:MAG: S41 family peptidase [Polyangiaceae bacterium]|jgi:carboxyl-terminal processing protease